MTQKRRTFLCLLLSSLVITACSTPSSQTKLTLTGSSTVAPLMNEIGKAYEAAHADVRVDVQTGGSSRGLADAREGVADLGMVSRSLKPDEADLTAFPVALDGIGIIVHAENPLTNITTAQLQQIYTGELTNWQALGGPDQPITVVNKAEGRSTLELFLAYLELESPQIQADVVIGDNEQGIKTVAGSPYSIGYVSIGAAENSAELGTPIKLLTIDGITASTDSVKAGQYPISRELNLVSPEAPTGALEAFVDFAQSADVHDLIESEYFVVHPSSVSSESTE